MARSRARIRFWVPILALAGGLFLALQPLFVTGFAAVPGGLGDARLVHFSLEHAHRFLLRHESHLDLWDPPLFFPARNVAAHTDVLLSLTPFYSPWRLLGAAPDTAFQLWLIVVWALNFGAFQLFLTRVLRLDPVAAAAGAYLFAFGGSLVERYLLTARILGLRRAHKKSARTANIMASLRFLRALILLATALAGSACFGCGVEKRPIGRLAAVPGDLELGYPEHRSLPMLLRPFAYPIAGGCPTLFVHLIGPDGRVARTFDHRPPAWRPGEDLGYDLTLYQSALAEPLPGGRYRLLAGAYSPDLGLRHVLEFAGEEVGRGRYLIGSVTMAEVAVTWQLGFAGGWEAPEAGTDSQVLNRRWFRRQATINLRDEAARESVELRLLLHLPPAAPADELDLEDGAREPRLEIAVPCASYRASFAPGRREPRLLIPAAALRQGCSVDLRANYVLRSPSLAEPRSGSLEAISWSSRDLAPR